MDPRYPIGRYEPVPFSQQQKTAWLQDIQFLPALLEQSLENLDDHQLSTPYREGGWNLKQVGHHLADSHINAYVRFKLALTEDHPTIKPYKEALWAQLGDVERVPVNISVTLLYTLHSRWHSLILPINDADWQRTLYHPEQQRTLTLWEILGMYAWHGRHHVAQIMALREQRGW